MRRIGGIIVGIKYSKIEINQLQAFWEKNVSVCILAGHFNFLCYRDKDWCINYLIPLLTSNDNKVFSSAWEGMTFFSNRINKDTVDILSPVYFKAINHIDWLGNDAKYRFVELLLTLLIYALENRS